MMTGASFLPNTGFLIGISLDILPESHDAVRVDTAGQGTYEQVLRSISLLKKYHIEHNVLCTLTRQTARHPAKVWAQIKKLDLSYIQFTPCLEISILPALPHMPDPGTLFSLLF